MKFFYNFCLKDDGAALDSDILSGVRKGYFNSFQKISDRITVNSDGDSLSYDYSIEKGKPMSWEVRSRDKKLLQDVTTAEDGKYYLCYYRDEKLCKRILFSRLHTLLKVEYYDLPTGLKTISLEPRKAKGGLCILYESAADPQPIVLYSASLSSDERIRSAVEKGFDDYTVIASTDDGDLWFLTDRQEKALKAFTQEIADELRSEGEQSFIGSDAPLFDKIKANDFNTKRNLATALDITGAAEFSFTREDKTAETDGEDAESTAVAEAAAAAISAALVGADAGAADDAVTVADDEPSADETNAVIKPDKYIVADSAIYSYYGELDVNGNRSGFGRTVTESGRTAYEGHYLNDKRSGIGSYYYKDGSLCYTGDWIENARHGIGVGVSSQDGSIHVGRWALNKPEGSGVRLTSDGDVKFVCKELSDGTTVLMNYLPNDIVTIAKYDDKGKKLGEMSMSLRNFLK